MNFAKLKRWLRRPQDPLKACVIKFGKNLPEELYLKLLLFTTACYWPNLKHPKTYNEKLQWLKLHYHLPEQTLMVDKISAKQYVESLIGSEHIIPTLRIWNSVDEINIDDLPQSFVLKTNQGCSNNGVIVVKDKKLLDLEAAKEHLRMALLNNPFPLTKEWPYKDIEPKVFAEQYIENKKIGDLMDYKFFCFNGEVKALFIGSERGTGDVKFDYYDSNFNHLDLMQEHPMSGKIIEKPETFEEMKRIASILSQNMPHVRVDLYDVEGHIYFGELTFFHHGGIMPFHPQKWDYEFGSWIKLPTPNA